MTEDELLAEVIRQCDELGLRWHHVFDSRRQPAGDHPGLLGWPDLAIFGRALQGVVFVELKSQQQRPSPEQREWGRAIQKAGCSWLLWRPADLRSGLIRRQLERLALAPLREPDGTGLSPDS